MLNSVAQEANTVDHSGSSLERDGSMERKASRALLHEGEVELLRLALP